MPRVRRCTLALVTLALSAACGPAAATSASPGAGGASTPECEWTKEYDRLPPGKVMAGSTAPADAGAD